MTKLVKTDHEIVPATSLAGKVEEVLADEGKLANVVEGVEICLCGHNRFVHSMRSMDDNDKPTGSCLSTILETMRQCTCVSYVPPPPSPYSSRDWAAALGETRIDAVGPGIPFTVEPLNPVLRAEGSREIVVDTETDKQALGRVFRSGVPATEMTATFESAKIITGKDGRPQLAVEMKVEGTGQKLTSVMPVDKSPDMLSDLIAALVNCAIGSPPVRGLGRIRCSLQSGHGGLHQAPEFSITGEQIGTRTWRSSGEWE